MCIFIYTYFQDNEFAIFNIIRRFLFNCHGLYILMLRRFRKSSLGKNARGCCSASLVELSPGVPPRCWTMSPDHMLRTASTARGITKDPWAEAYENDPLSKAAVLSTASFLR